MAQNSSKWLKMVKSGSKILQKIEMAKNDSKKFKMVQKHAMYQNGLNWFKMPQKGSKLLKTAQNGG